MNPGKVFEQQFVKSLPDDFYKLRLHDSASSFGSNDALRFSMKSPFDFIIWHKPYMYCVELKSTKANSFSFERSKCEHGEIHYHQIQALLEADKYGATAGLVLDFRESGTYWLDIKALRKFMNTSTKKSINEKDIMNNSGICIAKQKLRVNYKYDLKSLFDYIES